MVVGCGVLGNGCSCALLGVFRRGGRRSLGDVSEGNARVYCILDVKIVNECVWPSSQTDGVVIVVVSEYSSRRGKRDSKVHESAKGARFTCKLAFQWKL